MLDISSFNDYYRYMEEQMKTITKDKLMNMYYSLPNEEICKKLNISRGTLNKIIKENNIPLKGPANRVSAKIKIIS